MTRDDEADRARIAAVARAVLERSQWRNLKMRTVIKEADVSARRFYQLFHDQADLAVYLLQQNFDLLRQTLLADLRARPVGWANIEAFVTSYLAVFYDPAVDDARRYFHAHIEGEDGRRKFTAMRLEVLRALEEALAEAAANGAVRVSDPRRDARRIYDMLEGVIYSILWADRDEERGEVAPSVVGFVQRALGVDAAG